MNLNFTWYLCITLLLLSKSRLIEANSFESSSKITLLSHLQELVEQKSETFVVSSAVKKFENFLKYSQNRQLLSKIELVQAPKVGKCYDWRHFVSSEDYFETDKDKILAAYGEAASGYQMISSIGKILKEKFGLFEAYMSYWFPLQEAMHVIPTGEYNGLYHVKKKFIRIETVDKEAVISVVFPMKHVPGIQLSNGENLINAFPVPIFVIKCIVQNGQILNTNQDSVIECMLLQSKLCPCGRYCDWIQPKYTYPLIVDIFQQISQLTIVPDSVKFFSKLLLLIGKPNNPFLANHAFKTFFCDHQTQEYIKYASGLQILKDVWPGSKFYIAIFETAKLPFNRNKFFPLIYAESIFDNKDTHVVYYNPYSKVFSDTSFGQYNIFSTISTANSLYEDAFFAFPSYSAARKQFVDKFLKNYKSSLGIQMIRKAIIEISDQELMTNAINWQFSSSLEPIPTVKALMLLYKLLNTVDSFGMYSDGDSLGRLILFYHLYHNSSQRFRSIWLDTIKKGFVNFHIEFIVFDKVFDEADNPRDSKVEYIFPIRPFLYILEFSQDESRTLALIKKGPIIVPFQIKGHGMYVWENSEASLPLLLRPVLPCTCL